MEKVIRRKGEFVIPHEAIPEVMSRRTLSEDQGVCLERTEAMFTTYWASAGEISPFFLAVKEEKKIIGARCPRCGLIICPPYMRRCVICQKEDFSLVDLEMGLEMPQVGWMLGTPPITVFANARFARYAPFGRGRVILGESQSALPIQVFTTTGFLKPGIFRRGTQVKIIFRRQRLGFSTDYFAVPLIEVPESLRERSGVEETELSWKSLEMAEPRLSADHQKKFPGLMESLKEFMGEIPRSPRAQRDLTNWTRKILVKTGGGNFGLALADQRISLTPAEEVAPPDLILTMEDPALLAGWTRGDSLVNLIRTGRAGISNLQDMETIFKLDRLPRSVRRDREERAGK
ncbi:MAG: hypothetical protein HY697_03535 [Deltaproteobacteria bacterium]|nr:hypothetical protein [Deltaproteobacteria bacterium]